MHGFALLLVGLAVSAEPIELDRDVSEMRVLDFMMPLQFDQNAARLASVEKLRLFVSKDGGKTWKHHQDYGTDDRNVSFSAPGDGLYWFALQVVCKDGRKQPGDLNRLTPAMKVFVHTEAEWMGRLKKTRAELQQEAEELRKIVEELKRRNAELEAAAKRK